MHDEASQTVASFPGSCAGGGGKRAWYTLFTHGEASQTVASFPGSCAGGGGKRAWYTLFTHDEASQTVASSPGSCAGEEEREPGTHCSRMMKLAKP